MKIIFNGRLLDPSDPQVLVEDFNPEIISVFETFKVTQGRVPGTLKQHYERLFGSLQVMGIGIEYVLTQKILDDSLSQLLSTLDLAADYRIKIWASNYNWWIRAVELPPLDAAIYKTGVLVDEAVVERDFPTAKWSSGLYQNFWDQQAQSGAFETLFFNDSGLLLEGNVSNIVAVIDGRLVTPSGNVLPGITVRELFKKAEQKGLKTEFRDITREALETATEIFITNAIKGVVPVKVWGEWQKEKATVFDQIRD